MFDDEEDNNNKKKDIPTIEERFQHLILASTCLGALRLLRLRRNENLAISSLVSSRKAKSKLPNWEQDVVEMLTGK